MWIKDYIKMAKMALAIPLTFLALTGCGSEFDLQKSQGLEALIFVANDGDGTVSVIEHSNGGNIVSKTITVGSGGIGDMVVTSEDHIFVNVTDNNAVAAIDPVVDGSPELRNLLPAGSRPVHAYIDPEGTRVWVMNDGDAASGPCMTAGPDGSATGSVTLIQNHEVEGGDGGGGGAGTLGEVIATTCVGRGHHKGAFSYPTADAPAAPHRTFISNISDGTISVIDNDPASADYLKVIATIDLCDSTEEQSLGNPVCDADLSTINKSTPHGIDYSPVSGMIYNSNVGYGTVAVIDPELNTVATAIDIGFANKAHISPDGRFLIVKGADAKSDPDHIHGKLTVIDTADNSFKQTDITDVHPDSFEFTPDGKKLYVVSASSGSTAQKVSLKNNVVLVYDSSNLPDLTLVKEITVGAADGSHRGIAIHEHDGMAEHVIVPNPAEDTVSFIDSETDTVVDSVIVGDEPGSILIFSIGEGHSHM